MTDKMTLYRTAYRPGYSSLSSASRSRPRAAAAEAAATPRRRSFPSRRPASRTRPRPSASSRSRRPRRFAASPPAKGRSFGVAVDADVLRHEPRAVRHRRRARVQPDRRRQCHEVELDPPRLALCVSVDEPGRDGRVRAGEHDEGSRAHARLASAEPGVVDRNDLESRNAQGRAQGAHR